MIDSEALLIARKIKKLDAEAYHARMDAEESFDNAERQLRTSLAREGCRKVIPLLGLAGKGDSQSACRHFPEVTNPGNSPL